MKGMLQWALLSAIVVLIILVSTLGMQERAYEEALRTSSSIYATEIAGIINLLQTSPDATTHSYTLPEVNCKIMISSKDVNMTIIAEKKNSYIANLIQTSVKIEPAELDCDKKSGKTLRFVKDKDIIRIS